MTTSDFLRGTAALAIIMGCFAFFIYTAAQTF